jgi:activator of HSP90 ATPase
MVQRTLTRRGLVVSGITAMGAAAAATSSWAAPAPARGIRKNAYAIRQVESFEVPPERIFDVLLDAKKFAAMTGRAASIEPTVGGKFSLFDGVIFGTTLEIVANTRLVQGWRDRGWADGIYSIVSFVLAPHGGGTLLTFDHTAIPQDWAEVQSLALGWPEHYWEPLRKYLG